MFFKMILAISTCISLNLLAQTAAIPAGAPTDRDAWNITEITPSATVLPANPQGLVQITVKMATRPRRFAAVNGALNPINTTRSLTVGTSTSVYNITTVDLNFCEDRTLFKKTCEIKILDSYLEHPSPGRIEFKLIGGPNLGTVQEACLQRQTTTHNSFGGWGSRATTAEFVSDQFDPPGEVDMGFVRAPYECESHYSGFDNDVTPEIMASRITNCRTEVSDYLRTNSLHFEGLEVRGIAEGTACNSQLLTAP